MRVPVRPCSVTVASLGPVLIGVVEKLADPAPTEALNLVLVVVGG